MKFPFYVRYLYNTSGCYLDRTNSLIFLKQILATELDIDISMIYTIKLYHLFDMIKFKKACNLITMDRIFNGYNLRRIEIVYLLERSDIDVHGYPSKKQHFEIMYNWSKQYEHVINEEKTDNSSIEQKLLDTTLQKIEIFADIIQNCENKIEEQKRILLNQQSIIDNQTKQIKLLTKILLQIKKIE